MGFHINLELILVILTALSGFILLYYFFSKKNYSDEQEPVLLDYSRSFFPILLLVIVVRSFVAEPFRIPSGSMIPTLEIGDFVLVKKYAYGIKLPVLHNTIIDTGKPERGDVVVFRYPPNPKINYIKRLIGLPGDHVEWTVDKRLIINKKEVFYEKLGLYETSRDPSQSSKAYRLSERFPNDDNSHELIVFSGSSQAGQWVVPKGHYFMMGDNRDNSSDGRAWGFVPEKNLVGKASVIWMHIDWSKNGDGFKASRIGTSIK